MSESIKKIISIISAFAIILTFPSYFMSKTNALTTDFITSSVDIDSILETPNVDNVPTAFSESLFATHTTSWGFNDNTIFRTGLSQGYGLPITLKVNGNTVNYQSSVYRPSNVESVYEKSENAVDYGNIAQFASVSATFTSKYDVLSEINNGTVQYSASPRDRWSNYGSSSSEDTVTFSFGSAIEVDKLIYYPYVDTDAVALPSAVIIKYKNGGNWYEVPSLVSPAAIIAKTANEYGFDKVLAEAVSITFVRNASKYCGATEVEIYGYGKPTSNIAKSANVSASFTCKWDQLSEINDGIVAYEPSAGNRWSTYQQAGVTHYVQFDFNDYYNVNNIIIYPYDDIGGDNNVHLPTKVQLKYLKGGEWVDIENVTGPASFAQDTPAVFNFPFISTNAVRVYVTPEPNKAVGITELEVFGYSDDPAKSDKGVKITENKYITVSDVATSVITIENTGNTDKVIDISSKYVSTESEGMYVLSRGKGFDVSDSVLSKTVTLSAGEKTQVLVALALAEDETICNANIDEIFALENPLLTHRKEYLEWFEQNIPFFDADNEKLVQTYYFRWLMYRNNIRNVTYGDYKDNYVITEFLPNVSWAGAYNTINCAASQHIYEGRWLRNNEYVSDYQKFWLTDEADAHKYSFPMADAYYANYLVNGDKTSLLNMYESIASNYADWEDGTISSNYVEALGLYHQADNYDGMEASIGGGGLRPTINSYMYADALALSKISDMMSDSQSALSYLEKASTIKTNIENVLWNETDKFFETVNSSTGSSVGVRELVGYIPWMYNIPSDDEKYQDAWYQLFDTDGFKANYGPTSAEQRNPDFMAVQNGTCRWDGPSWPFATAQTLTAFANYLNNYENTGTVTKNEYWDVLMTYTDSHFKNGYSWLAENLDPYTGEWYVDHPRSIHYNHSTFNDLVITGLAGLRPDDNDDILIVNPLVPEGELSYFIIENIRYRNHNITISYDKDGLKYQKGFNVYVDGKLASSKNDIAKTQIALNDNVPEAPEGLEFTAVTDTSITVTALQGAEYSIDGGKNWQDSNIFEKLSTLTQYSIIARIKATDSSPAGLVSEPITTTTTGEHSYTVKYDENEHWLECADCKDTLYKEVHEYTNSCDTTCNFCDYTREITHNYESKYDNINHFSECSVCNEQSNVAPHTFDDINDTSCNDCGFVLPYPRLKAALVDEYNMIDKSKAVMLAQSSEYASLKQGEYVTVNWCGKDYTLKVGEDLFVSIADIESQNFDNPHILVKAYPKESAFYLTKPASVFTQNYASNPVKKGVSPDGSDWEFNSLEFNTDKNYDIEVNNLGVSGAVIAGDYNYYGFTFRYHIIDYSTTEYINIHVENSRFLSNNWGNSTTDNWANAVTANTFIGVSGKNSAGIDSLTLKNIYITTGSGDYAGTIFADTMHEHVVYDGLFVDIPTTTKIKQTNSIRQYGTDTSFTITNSCFKNYALYDAVFYGSQKAVAGQNTKVVIKNNIFNNSELRGKYDGIIAYVPDSITELTYENNRVYAPEGCQMISTAGSAGENKDAPLKMTIRNNYIDYSLYDYTSGTDRNYTDDSIIADNYIELANGNVCGRFKITGTAERISATSWYLDAAMTMHSSVIYPMTFDGKDFGETVNYNVSSQTSSVDLESLIGVGYNSVEGYLDESLSIPTALNNVTVATVGSRVYVKVYSADKSNYETRVINVIRADGFTVGNTGLGSSFNKTENDTTYNWLSWRGVVNATGSLTFKCGQQMNHRVGVIYFSELTKVNDLKAAILAEFTKDGTSLLDADAIIDSINASVVGTENITAKAYVMSANKTFVWDCESQNYGYRYNFSVPDEYVRGAIMYAVYEGENGLEVTFSDIVVQKS